ncbi:MAG: hypothetical protein JXQ73_15920 [Phycisphaerae bacterium]|nr:hypothetical protein [Phycisphaerae bacterium]
MPSRAAIPIISLMLCLSALSVGCGKLRREPAAKAPVAQAPAPIEMDGPPGPEPISIDLGQVGAEGEKVEYLETKEKPWPRRRFTFLVTGVGCESKKGSPVERKAAALEAAVVDAIGRAAREMLRNPSTGKAPVEYRMTLGPGLTVFGQLVQGQPQTAILLDHRGRIDELCARQGVLAHPPHGTKIIQQIFAATDGQLVLQATRQADTPGCYTADVGYYQKSKITLGTQPTSTREAKPVIATGR